MIELENQILQDKFNITTYQGKELSVDKYFKVVNIFCRKTDPNEPFAVELLVINNISEFYKLEGWPSTDDTIENICERKEYHFSSISKNVQNKVLGYIQYNENTDIITLQ